MEPQAGPRTTTELGRRLPQTMRAIIYDDYGSADVLRLAERPLPHRHANQLLIEVHASSVNPIDYRLRRGEMKGLLPGGFPRTPGYDVAGRVVDCPVDVAFSRGDRVLAFLDHLRGGACAEYAVCRHTSAAKLPDDIPFADAAAIPLAGTTALQSLRDHGQIQPGDRVLINGASGGVGMFAVQIAKAYQCEVDAVASGRNEAFCFFLGADNFYDYRQTNITATRRRWDIIFDAAGKMTYLGARKILNRGGRFVSTEPSLKGMLMTLITRWSVKPGKVMLAIPSGNDLRQLIDLYRQGKLRVTLDSRFPLAETAAAQRRVESGVEHGKVVIDHSSLSTETHAPATAPLNRF